MFSCGHQREESTDLLFGIYQRNGAAVDSSKVDDIVAKRVSGINPLPLAFTKTNFEMQETNTDQIFGIYQRVRTIACLHRTHYNVFQGTETDQIFGIYQRVGVLFYARNITNETYH